MKKAVVIGLGDISPIHLAAINKNPNIELAGVCDIDSSLKEFAGKGIPFYTDYNTLIHETKPDCAHICLPHHMHFPVSEDLAKKGIHLFCEKPLALHAAEGIAFSRLENLYGVKICLCLQNRRNASSELLKKLLESGQYGQVTGVRGSVFWYRPKSYYEAKPWRGQMSKAGGGCMINQSIHTMDLMQFFCASPLESLRGTISQLLDYGLEVEDTAAARMRFKNGASGTFFATVSNYENQNVEITLQCEKAAFCIRDNALFQISDENLHKLAEDERMEGSKAYYGASHGKLISEFYQVLEGSGKDYIHPADGLTSIQMIDGIRESSQTGKTIFF